MLALATKAWGQGEPREGSFFLSSILMLDLL